MQAYDIDPDELRLARQRNAPLIPHWYSLPRWIWAPLPQDAAERDKIVAFAVSGGNDVIAMPRYYQPWKAGVPALRARLKKVDDVAYFSGADKKLLRQRLHALGYATDEANSIPLTGRGNPLLAVFDPATAALTALVEAN